MPYRRTPKMEARLAETRERIIQSALGLVASGGYAAASIPAIAAEVDISAGLIYRHFDTKADLFNEVFRRAAQMEIDACEAAAATGGTVRERLANVVSTFATRALRGRQLAWALLAEPVDPVIEAARLQFREPYRAIFARLIDEGIDSGEIAPQPSRVAGTAIVGAIAETLVGPLSTPTRRGADAGLVQALTAFCVRSLGPVPGDKVETSDSSTATTTRRTRRRHA
ncbi:TetR/AcrR family transcriptional regulator [Cupriavidus sp. AU9028]|nr:TetR/AcrR family transcriptional regulator [Cupriavidus sp. AU9028]